MNRIRSAGRLMAASVAFAAVAPALADNSEIAIEPAPGWVTTSEPLPVPEDVQGLVFYRSQDTIAHLTREGHYSYQSQVIRILQPQALQAGNIAISWNPAAGRAVVHSLKIRRGPREIDVLGQTSFEILRREDQLEQAMLTGTLTAVLQVPDLRVGDDLEIAYTVPLHDPTLRDISHGVLFLGDAPPPGRFSLRLSWEDGQEPQVRMTEDFGAVASRTGNAISLDFENPGIVTLPRNAPPRYSWTRILEFSDFDNWETVSGRFHALYADAATLAPDSPLREEAAIIAESHDNDLDRAQAALELVQQQIRYIYIGLNGGNYTPASADETWTRRYGDCKGKTALLLALLGAMGIEAQGVLVNNSVPTDGLDTKLPNPGHFDHIIVRAKIGGKDYFLDGTLPAVIDGRTDPFLPYQWVLPLTEAGSELERLPDRVFDLPQEMGLIEIDARAGFDAPARRVSTTMARGIAGLQQYLQLSGVPANQLEAALRSRLEGSAEWDTIESIAYRFDKRTQASILTIKGTGPVDWDDEGGGAYDLILPGGGFYPPERRQRGDGEGGDIPFYQNPIYTCYATTVRLPDGTDLKNWGFNSTIDTLIYGRNFYRMMELRDDRTLRMVRGSRVEQQEIPVQKAERDNGRLANFDNSMAVLSYDPAGTGPRYGRLRQVPATYEIDWTGDNPPCLPPDVLAG